MDDRLGQFLSSRVWSRHAATMATLAGRGRPPLNQPSLDLLLASQLFQIRGAVLALHCSRLQEAVMTLILSKRVIFVLATTRALALF